MKLTLPQAGVDPGRAARAPQVAVNESAGAIADFGKVMLDMGTTIVNDRLDRQFNRNQVDLTRDVNDLRLRIEEIGDPDAADAAWENGVTQLRNAYMAPGEDGTLRVDPRNAERFGLAMDQLVNKHAFSVGARNLALRQSQHIATYNDYVYEASRAAATSDADTRATMIAQGDEMIASMLEAGVYTPEQAQKARADIRSDLSTVAALQALNDDPADFLERREKGEFAGLGPEMAVRMDASAKDALIAQAELEQKAAEKAASDARKAVSNDLGRIASLSDTTRLTPDDRALLDDPAVAEMAQEDPDLALDLRKAQARVSLDEEKRLFSAMSPPELAKAIEDERARKVKHPFQEERLTVLEDLLDSKQKALAADPIKEVAASGFAPPELPMDGDLAGFEKGLAARKAYGEWMRAQGWTEDVVVFRPDERAALKAQLAADADPAARQTLLTGITRQLGADAARVIETATGDKVSAHAATLIGAGAPPDVVADALTGQKRLKDGSATRPSAAEFRATFATMTGGVFHGSAELEARIMDTAIALYAEAVPNADSTEIDAAAAQSAISRAVGGDGAGLGGIATVDAPGWGNSYTLPLPPGVSARQVDGAIAATVNELLPRTFHPTGSGYEVKDKPIPADFGRLTRASLNGKPPVLGDHPSAMFEDLRITPVWRGGRLGDTYVLTRKRAGQWIAVQDTAGEHYVFSLRKFVQGAGDDR